MEVLGWLAIPFVATVLAIVWVSVRNRPRPPADIAETLEERERFRRAMERPTPGDQG